MTRSRMTLGTTPEQGLVVRWLATEEVRPGWAELLDDGERRRLGARSGPQERARFLGAAVLMRRTLAEVAEVEITTLGLDRRCADCGEPHGRPVPTGSAAHLHVGASHSGSVVLVAVAERAVGVDVELVRGRMPSPALLRRVLAPGEAAPADPLAFARLWSAKEAYLKAIGTGLATPMSQVRLEGDRAVPLAGSWPAGRLVELEVPTGVAAAAWVCVLERQIGQGERR